MYASLTVVSHPKRRLLSALVRARRVARAASHRSDIAFARALQAGTFRTDPLPPYVPGLVAVMLWAHEIEILEDLSDRLLGPLYEGAIERWRVLLQPVSIHGAWLDFAPECNGVSSLRPEEPVVALIHGILKARYLPKFARDNAEVGKQLVHADGYLAGLALADTPLTTASFSCWRSANDSRRFAFAAGAHRDAYKIDRQEQRHATEFFVRFRPRYSDGTLGGRDPFERILN
jgi:hypothetical protein